MIFSFQNCLKNADSPLGSNSEIFEFENILTVEDTIGQAYLGILTLKMGKVIDHSDIYENLRSPLGYQKSKIEIGAFSGGGEGRGLPLPLLGILCQFFYVFSFVWLP